MALPMGELARLKAVTERVPRYNQRTNVQTCDCKRPLRLAVRSPAPPEGEPRAAAPPWSHCLTLCTGRAKPDPWLSLWESWHGAAVTERVPSHNHRIFSNLPLPTPSQSRFARQLPQSGSQGRLRRRFPAVLPSGLGGQRPPLGSPYGRAGTAQP